MSLFHVWVPMPSLLLRSEPFAKPKNFITLQKRVGFAEKIKSRSLDRETKEKFILI